MNSPEYELYPFELSLNRIKKVWGGWPGKIGEIWSLSGPPHESLILNGSLAGRRLTELVGDFQQKLLGKGMELDPREPFPLLLKFISTGRDLPIQVHPHDAYTLENGLPMVGRDKICYILKVENGGRLYLGFREKIDEKTIRKAVAVESLHHLMNSVPLKKGELYTVPAGRIHAVGKGITFIEIQRHSDLTFRLFDWNSKAKKGDDGDYQMEEALKVLDFNPISPKPIPKVTIDSGENSIEFLALTPHFTLRRLSIKESMDLPLKGSRFVVYTGLRGTGWVRWGFSEIYSLIQPYQSILIPAIPEDLSFETENGIDVLETSVPDLTGGSLTEMIGLRIPPESIVGLGGEDYGKILKGYLG